MGTSLIVVGGYKESPILLFVLNAFLRFQKAFLNSLFNGMREYGAVYSAVVETAVMLPCSVGSKLCRLCIKDCGYFLFSFCNGESL